MPTGPRPPPAPLRRRLGWFGLLYVASLVSFAAIVYALRSLVPR